MGGSVAPRSFIRICSDRELQTCSYVCVCPINQDILLFTPFRVVSPSIVCLIITQMEYTVRLVNSNFVLDIQSTRPKFSTILTTSSSDSMHLTGKVQSPAYCMRLISLNVLLLKSFYTIRVIYFCR